MGQTAEHKIRHVFLTTGADPNTSWLDGCVSLDPKGFIKTGSELSPENLSAARWPLLRPPYLLESLFAGGVRGGRRARRQHQACCVRGGGEGSIAISFVHSAPGIGSYRFSLII
jgi:thioredoxin reductase (NADPH)